MKKQAFYSSAHAMGDLICATPTIKKLSEIYQSPITVISTHPYLFDNCPYVDESLRFDDYTEEQLSEKYDLHKTFFLLGKQDSRGVEFKHAMCDIRQFHAKDLGFMLTPNELTCEYFPKSDESCLSEFNLPERYVVIHPAQSWSSRTWSKYNWQALCISLEDAGIPVISIGKDAREESDFSGTTLKPVFNLDIKNGLDLANKTTLDQSWHILNKSTCVITMDSGVLHLAGTTDTHIIQLGSSIKPEYRAPYRLGSQGYKYSHVSGSCGLHCASNLKYSLRDWGHIQSVTLIATCLEKKSSFECNPSFSPVSDLVKKVWSFNQSINPVDIKPKLTDLEPKTLVEIQSNALGDTIGAMAVIEKWRKETGKEITVLSNFSDLFKKSYPNLDIHNKKNTHVQYLPTDGIWIINDKIYTEKILTTYKFEVPLLEGYAQDFGITTEGIELNIDLFKKERPIQSKYVCIAVQSTTQAKYWNHPGGWDELCKMLRKKGLTPVCIDKDFSFGIKSYFNEAPSKAVKKNGLSLEDTINYLYHCEMFIGLSSGLSWVAQAVKKPTVIISNVTSKDHEYIDDRTLRIYEESVCHGCFHKYPFDASDWLWCPVYRNDEVKRFICTKAITPESVMEQIEKFYNI
jgi:autotransporter strand-loop-strand O-heptosyltransferase